MPYAERNGVRLYFERDGIGDPELLFLQGSAVAPLIYRSRVADVPSRAPVRSSATTAALRVCGASGSIVSNPVRATGGLLWRSEVLAPCSSCQDATSVAPFQLACSTCARAATVGGSTYPWEAELRGSFGRRAASARQTRSRRSA